MHFSTSISTDLADDKSEGLGPYLPYWIAIWKSCVQSIKQCNSVDHLELEGLLKVVSVTVLETGPVRIHTCMSPTNQFSKQGTQGLQS